MTIDSKRFAFITCVNNEELYSECALYINSLNMPAGFSKELIPIHGAKSMCEGYNRGMRATFAKYKVFLHQDTLIVNKNLMSDLINIFADASIGLVGVIGCKLLPRSGVWWDGLRTYGRVLHACEPESVVDSHCKEPENGAPYAEVQACDGLFLAGQYNIPWRDDLFDGFHLYDTSYCLENQKRGYKTVIPNQEKMFWCIHCPKEKPLDPVYKKYRRIFTDNYSDMLSPEV